MESRNTIELGRLDVATLAKGITLHWAWKKEFTGWAAALFLGGVGMDAAGAEKRWFISSFGGVGTHNNIGQITEGQVDLADSYIFGLAGGQEIYRFKKWIGLEWEGQVAKHFDLQDHWEFNILISPRWHAFPWDRFLDTSFAFGNGLSYATEDPEIEIIKNDETSRLLHYFYFELDFKIPKQDHWSVYTRIHHRSGVFGLFDGVHGGSNFFTGGVRYTF